MEPIPRRSAGVVEGEEPEALFLLVLSCPVEGGWDLLKDRVRWKPLLHYDPPTHLRLTGTRSREPLWSSIRQLY